MTIRKNLVITLFLCCLMAVSLSAQEYGPDRLSAAEKDRWAKLSGRQAGQELLGFRVAGDDEGFANRFVLFLDQGRKTSEILALLKVVGLPLTIGELVEIGDILMNAPADIHHRNCVENGYHLDIHSTPSMRLQLLFLNEEERRVYRKWGCGEGKLETPREKEVAAELEGRMCVWAKDRKIHLAGPRFVYDRVRRICGHFPTRNQGPASDSGHPDGHSQENDD